MVYTPTPTDDQTLEVITRLGLSVDGLIMTLKLDNIGPIWKQPCDTDNLFIIRSNLFVQISKLFGICWK